MLESARPKASSVQSSAKLATVARKPIDTAADVLVPAAETAIGRMQATNPPSDSCPVCGKSSCSWWAWVKQEPDCMNRVLEEMCRTGRLA